MAEQAGAETEAEAEDRLRHGSSFGAAASAYAEHRPGYAEAAVRWAVEPAFSLPPGAPGRPGGPPRVVDLGAGTGKLTAALVRTGAEVTAVEPDQDMLAELRRRLPPVRTLAGRAEQIPLPDGSVEAVLAGQAMHWFDLDRALPEIARVLVPGGVLAGLWNVDDDRVGWVAELAEVSKREASPTLLRWRAGVGHSRAQQLLTAGSGLFDGAEAAEFGHGQPRTADSLLATIGTHSHLLVMPEPERVSRLARIRDFLRGRPETSDGEFVLPMVTMVLRARRTRANPRQPHHDTRG